MRYRFDDKLQVNYQVNDMIDQIREEKKALEDFEEILLTLNNLLAFGQARKEVISALDNIEHNLISGSID